MCILLCQLHEYMPETPAFNTTYLLNNSGLKNPLLCYEITPSLNITLPFYLNLLRGIVQNVGLGKNFILKPVINKRIVRIANQHACTNEQ